MIEAARKVAEAGLTIRQFNNGALPETPLVLVHGWGSDSRVWEPLATQLAQPLLLVDLPACGAFSLDGLIALLAETLPRRCHLIGWSLGGMLATAYAISHPERVQSLVCIATNLRFQADSDWRQAMPATTFSTFKENFIANPQLTLKRFRALQAKGDQHERQLIKALERIAVIPANGSAMLQLLGELDNRADARQLSMPALYLFGATDQLVPAQAASEISAVTRIQVETLPHQGHVPHLSDPAALATRLMAFYRTPNLDKQKIAQSFGRSAATYDSAAHLQRAVGDQLLSRLHTAAGPVVDIGCGTGHFSDILKKRFPSTPLLGIDLAEGMARHASLNRAGPISWLCGDVEQMPLANQSIGLLFSNLTIQWCEQLEQLAAEIHRVLRPGGTALLSTLGPRTLHEMRAAWREVDGFVHVNRFTPAAQLKRYFQSAGFSEITLNSETRVVYYPDVLALSRELKALGAHNLNSGRPAGMTGRRRLQQFAAAYEQFREQDNRQLPVSWEVIYCEVRK